MNFVLKHFVNIIFKQLRQNPRPYKNCTWVCTFNNGSYVLQHSNKRAWGRAR